MRCCSSSLYHGQFVSTQPRDRRERERKLVLELERHVLAPHFRLLQVVHFFELIETGLEVLQADRMGAEGGAQLGEADFEVILAGDLIGSRLFGALPL